MDVLTRDHAAEKPVKCFTNASLGVGRIIPNPPRGTHRLGFSAAFSLLEVLVALMIFALSAVVLGSTYVNILNSYEAVSRGNTRDEDVAFARAQMLVMTDRAKVEAGAEFDSLDNRHVRWSATLASTSLPDLFTVTFVCEVTDSAKGGDPAKTTQTFTVLRPTWSDATEKTQLRQAVQDRIAEIQGKTKK
ncbi:MAG: type II secretion system protein [Undibacterium sp.]|nr:type II secretion system protein [Opitutaceae bacterium]